MGSVNITPKRAIDLVAAIAMASGSPESEARGLGENLVDANLTGHDSHGVSMLPLYIDMVRAGTMNVGAAPKIVAETAATLVVEGNRGYGQTIMAQATDMLCAKAKKSGAAVLALRETHHIGRIGAWAERCAKQGLASIFLVDVAGVDAKVAPHNGRDARLGTNPICLGFPRKGKPPIIADMATSRVAVGKIRVSLNKGERIAEGLIIDAEGKPSTDPATMFTDPMGALLTMADHKGYALSVMMEMFSGALGGGSTIATLQPHLKRIVNNCIAVAIDPAALGTEDTMTAEADRMEAWLKASPKRGADDILLPGEPELASRAKRAATFPVDDGTWKLLADIARDYGIDAKQYLA
ncbi:MAG: malate/lactate/ureidoglycolate dehydrogenase [Proteobacteria bacterium]|nr:malate/lactate/ureidoglycolate dehydrogenase [Pseudomonadota bacterium]